MVLREIGNKGILVFLVYKEEIFWEGEVDGEGFDWKEVEIF